ncbi:MAG TPA: NAD(P)H oxidoreductase [Lentisphaeria bacterium]|nr:MAG: NAD(P)H oxidoreductase [Lentisphaerae bacterium GWF2_38_69]HBM16322.1 NAD(P)H oxidoreductase [Lentisphaeria bacterium]
MEAVNKILILFTHPRFEKSKVNKALLKDIGKLSHVTLHDLYETYPDFNIDVEREKTLLSEHSVIIWHHPIYMYGVPPLMKQWMDIVLEHGWAYGKGGDKLKGKLVFNAVTVGGQKESYRNGGHNGYSIRTFLAPYEQTARLCSMEYLPPFVVHGTYLLTDGDLEFYREQYLQLLDRIIFTDIKHQELKKYEYLNEWIADKGVGNR